MNLSTAQLKDLLSQHHKGEISFSRMVELLNEQSKSYASECCKEQRIACADVAEQQWKSTLEHEDFYNSKIAILDTPIVV